MFAEQSLRSEDHRLGMKKVQHCSRARTAVPESQPLWVFLWKCQTFQVVETEVGLREAEPTKPSLIQTKTALLALPWRGSKAFTRSCQRGFHWLFWPVVCDCLMGWVGKDAKARSGYWHGLVMSPLGTWLEGLNLMSHTLPFLPQINLGCILESVEELFKKQECPGLILDQLSQNSRE